MSISGNARRLVAAIGILAALAACAAALVPVLARPSNCGGNSAASAACKGVLTCYQIIAAERGDKPVSIAGLTTSEREHFSQVAGLSWLGDATILVTPAPVAFDAQRRQILAVCDKPFDNVPRRIFGKSPMTHAAVYTDGSRALISVEDFRKLDLSGFIDLRKVQERATQQEEPPTATSSRK